IATPAAAFKGFSSGGGGSHISSGRISSGSGVAHGAISSGPSFSGVRSGPVVSGGAPGRVMGAPTGSTSFAALPPRTRNAATVQGGQWSGKNWSGKNWSGNWSGKHHHHRRHFPAFAFALGVGAGYYGDYYNSCWQVQQVWTRYGWAYQRVYVCDDYDY